MIQKIKDIHLIPMHIEHRFLNRKFAEICVDIQSQDVIILL